MEEKSKQKGDENMAGENDRELLIRLETKVDTLIENFKIIPKLEERIRCIENKVYSMDEMKKDIEKLENKSNTWSIINSVGVVIATILGSVFGSK